MRTVIVFVVGLFCLVAISGCDLDRDNPGNNDGNIVYCTGDKSDDPNCVNPDANESPPGDDTTSESLDSESTFVDSAGELTECIPTVPEGALVMCDFTLKPCKISWDMSNCTASCWSLGRNPTRLFWDCPPDVLIGSDLYQDFNCAPIDE